MKRWTLWAALGLLASLVTGCPEGPPTATDSPTAKESPAKTQHLAGEIHVDGQRKRVAPFVVHEPGLDLRVQCLSRRDTLAKEDKTIPLCFDETGRKVGGAVMTLRIEHREGMRIAEALQPLRTDNGAAHFVVDDGGTPYQLLDLALTARREGSYRPAEVRVLSGHAEGHDKLAASLRALYPTLTVAIVEVKRPAPAPKPKAETPAAAAPASPQEK